MSDCVRPAPLVEESLVRDALVFSPRWPGWVTQRTATPTTGKRLRRPASQVWSPVTGPTPSWTVTTLITYLALRYELRTGGDLGARVPPAGQGLEQRALYRRDAKPPQTVGRGSVPTEPRSRWLMFTAGSSRQRWSNVSHTSAGSW